MSNIFEQASRKALRFESTKGLQTVEDLWNLPLDSARGSSLNSIAKAVNKVIKESEEETFVGTKSNALTEENLKLDILKHIIKVRQEENEKAVTASKIKKERERILEMIAVKKDQALAESSVEELEAKLKALEG